MGREVRHVPADWKHPKDGNGHYIQLHDGKDFSKKLSEWRQGKVKWDEGFRTDFNGGWKQKEGDELSCTYEDWMGDEPSYKDYMPEWSEEEKTHLMMYEDCTEGTPISPAFKTPEELARWLADNKASAFGDNTATYDKWLLACKEGWVPTAIMLNGKIESGVSGLKRLKEKEAV